MLDGVPSAGEHVEDVVGATRAHRLGQVQDVAGEPVHVGQPDHAVVQRGVLLGVGEVAQVPGHQLLEPGRLHPGRSRLPGHQVAQHRAGLDRGELVGVADQHQPAVVPQRLGEPGHQGQRHHRRLVDDHDVVGQPVGPVVPEPSAGPGLASPAAGAASRPSGCRAGPGRRRPCRDVTPATASVSRAAALPVGAAIATRSGSPAWSASTASSFATVVVLPVPGPPASTLTHRWAATTAASRCRSESSAGNSRATASATRSGSTVGLGPCGGPVEHVGDAPLLAPVAVEVEQPAHPAQRAVRGTVGTHRDQRAALEGGGPGGRLGPRQRRDHGPVHALHRGDLRDRGEVEAHRPVPERAHREGDREQHALVGLRAEASEPGGDVHVGGTEHADAVEVGEQSGRPSYLLGTEEVERDGRLGLGRHGAPRSRRSERSVTSAAGGDQEKTPHGIASTTGVAGPHMPRRKR